MGEANLSWWGPVWFGKTSVYLRAASTSWCASPLWSTAFNRRSGNLQKLYSETMHTSCHMHIDFITMCTKYVLVNQHLPRFRLIWLPAECRWIARMEFTLVMTFLPRNAYIHTYIHLEYTVDFMLMHIRWMMKIVHWWFVLAHSSCSLSIFALSIFFLF